MRDAGSAGGTRSAQLIIGIDSTAQTEPAAQAEKDARHAQNAKPTGERRAVDATLVPQRRNGGEATVRRSVRSLWLSSVRRSAPDSLASPRPSLLSDFIIMSFKGKGKKGSILDLNKYMDQLIRVKFSGGREVTGILKGYDPLINLVLDDTKVRTHSTHTDRNHIAHSHARNAARSHFIADVCSLLCVVRSSLLCSSLCLRLFACSFAGVHSRPLRSLQAHRPNSQPGPDGREGHCSHDALSCGWTRGDCQPVHETGGGATGGHLNHTPAFHLCTHGAFANLFIGIIVHTNQLSYCHLSRSTPLWISIGSPQHEPRELHARDRERRDQD